MDGKADFIIVGGQLQLKDLLFQRIMADLFQEAQQVSSLRIA
jgi:hypothetical protein